VIILAPVYQPGYPLLRFVTSLREAAPDAHVVIVDDGSDAAHSRLLDEAKGLGCVVLRHPANRGKGTALKTGLRHIREQHPGQDVICADPDGQHHIADVVRVAKHVQLTGRIVLGVRHFDTKVPLRSRFGNTVTRLLFRAATGQPVRDTQTGLRAYPASLLDWLDSVPGERFEYEMNVLLYAARAGHPIEQLSITTTYVDDNSSSHFSSVTDSARVYGQLLRFATSPKTSG
jgi:glycosyltransferase involved in cell wall biosynthesis